MALNPNDHNTKVYDRKGSKRGWGIGAFLVALLAVGLVAWMLWPNVDEDVAVTGTVPPPAAVEAPAVPPAAVPAPVPAEPAARP